MFDSNEKLAIDSPARRPTNSSRLMRSRLLISRLTGASVLFILSPKYFVLHFDLDSDEFTYPSQIVPEPNNPRKVRVADWVKMTQSSKESVPHEPNVLGRCNFAIKDHPMTPQLGE